MEESSGQRPFMKLKLSPAKPVGEAAVAPETPIRPADAAPEGNGEKAPASKTASPFIKAPANLSPSASRTPPVAKTAKPAAPGAVSELACAAPGTDSPPPPSSPEAAPTNTQPEIRRPEHATKSPLLTFSSIGTAPPASTKLKLNVTPGPGETPPAFPEVPAEGASVSGDAGAGGVKLAPASDSSGAPEPASTEGEARSSGATPSATTTAQTRARAKKAVAPQAKNPVAVIAAGAGVALLLGLGVLAMKHFSGPAVEATSETLVTPPATATSPVATDPSKLAESPRDAAGSEEPAQVAAPETAELARTRNPDLIQWLDGVRITAVSSDRITINRRIYAFGAFVNPEGTLKWVGRDSVKGNLLFIDAAGVVYEKAPR